MTASGFDVSGQKTLLDRAKQALTGKDFAAAQTLAEEIIRLKDEAYSVDAGIAALEKRINEAENAGRETAESRNALELAKEAFARGDYDRAQARLNAAQLTFAIESQRINITSFLARWWWMLLICAFLAAFLLRTAWRELKLWDLTRRLESLHKEEKALSELMTRAQREYYKERKLPKVEFYRDMYEYEKRLEKVREAIAKLTSEKMKMVKVVEELNRLELEDKKIKGLIMDLQHRYFEEGGVSKDTYARQMKAYVARRAEIAQSSEISKARAKAEGGSAAGRAKRESNRIYDRFMSALERLFRMWRK
jgi:cell division protein FtsL